MKKKIRIVYGLTDFIVGGMQRQFSEQLPLFDANRFEIILITLSQHPEKSELYAALPAELPIHRLDFKGIKDVRSWWRLYKLLSELKPDIVVSSIFFANTVFRVLKPLVGYVAIAREHNTYVNKPRVHRIIDKMLAYLSYRIVAVASPVATFTAQQEGIVLSKFETITNGINLEKAWAELAKLPQKGLLKKELGYAADDRIVLNVARLVAQKNHDVLIDGFKAFHKAHPEYKLAIVGAGGLREALQERIEQKQLGESVTLFGMRSDVWRFYKAADIFVSAAGIEGMSNAELEAMAAGLPLVSTETSGTDELLEEGKNGFFIRSITAAAVAESLESAATASPESLGRASLERVKDFDIRVTVKKYEDLFFRACS